MRELHIGIDLALKSDHRATVYAPQEDRFLDKSFGFDRSFEGFEYLLTRVHQHVAEGEESKLIFIMEPTGGAWIPLSCYLAQRGHMVYRVTTQKSSDYRKFLSKYTKSDRVDSKALARLPSGMGKENMYPVYLPNSDLSALSRYTKQLAKMSREIASRKVRIQSIFSMINPKVLDAFGDKKFTIAARSFYKHFFNPFEVVKTDKEEFFAEFRNCSRESVAKLVLDKIYQASLSTVKIYEPMLENHTLPFDLQQIGCEIHTELRLLEGQEAELARIQRTIEVLYKKIDPEGYLMSIRGIGKTIAPAVLGIVGDVSRFPTIGAFKKYFGFVPKKKLSASKEKQDQKITKAAQKLLKKYLFLAADVARHWDPEFAAFYEKLVQKGLHHFQAVCALANKMAGRVYSVLKRMQRAENSCYRDNKTTMDPAHQLKPKEVRYQLRDHNGRAISKEKARGIIQEKFPSKAQRKRESENRNSKKTLEQRGEQKDRERTASQKSLSDQPRQSLKQFDNDSSKRSRKTLPVAAILKDTFPEVFRQDRQNDENWQKLKGSLEELRSQVEKQDC